MVSVSAASNVDRAWPVRREFAQKLAHTWIALAGVAYFVDLLRQTRDGLTDGDGRPFGDDFINYWSGAFLAWHQRAVDVYDWTAFHTFQQSIVGADLNYYHYSYPPILLVLTAPLAALPYVPGLLVWLTSSWFCFYRALRLAMPGKGALLLALATPAVFVSAVGGQNAAWTAAFFGGGLLLLDRRPFVAGALFALLSYKPQVGLLIPIALVAGRQWRAVAGAVITGGVLIFVSLVLFGPEVWIVYVRNIGVLRQLILEDGSGVWHRMVSVFVFARRLGADVWTAYIAQGTSGLFAAWVVAVMWFKDVPAQMRNSALLLGTCLVTPYLQDYDLVFTAFVAIWLTTPVVVPANLQRAAHIIAGLILILPAAAAAIANVSGLVVAPLLFFVALLMTARIGLLARSSGAPEFAARA
jgi:arabinofuranan 3-O-arabinosyltransferase